MSTTSKVKTTLDGGPYNCGKHDPPFTTTDPKEWQEHIKEEGHYDVGQKKCVMCGEMKTLTHEDQTPVMENYICLYCGDKILGRINKAKENQQKASSSNNKVKEKEGSVSKKK